MSVNQIVPTPFLSADSDVYQVLHKATMAAMKLRMKVTPGKWVEKLENGQTELFKSSDAMEVFANKRHSLEKLERYAMKNIEIFEREFDKKDKKIKQLEDQLKKNAGNRESKVDIRATQQEANRALEVSRPSKNNENTDEEARGAENQPPNAPSDLESRNEAEVKRAEEERMKKEEMEKKNEENKKEGAENSKAGPPNKKEGEKKKKKVPTVSTVTRRSQRLNVPQQADTAEEKRGEDMVPENADLSMVEDEGMEMEGGEEVNRDNKVDGKEMRKTFTKDNRKQIVAYADEKGNNAAALLYSVHFRTIRKWRQLERDAKDTGGAKTGGKGRALKARKTITKKSGGTKKLMEKKEKKNATRSKKTTTGKQTGTRRGRNAN